MFWVDVRNRDTKPPEVDPGRERRFPVQECGQKAFTHERLGT